MDLNGAIAGRRAVREYTVQAVDEKSIRAMRQSRRRAL
jgi:hypothetical protein